MDSVFYRVAVATLLIGFVGHRGYYTRRVQHSADSVIERPPAGAMSQIATLLIIPALLATVIYVTYPEWMSWSQMPLPNWLRCAGGVAALAGFALLQWSQVTLGKNWSDAPKLVAHQQLIVRGPYRWIRHPIYAAFLLILGALVLVSANWLVGGLWITMTALDVASRMRTEEAMLLCRFGESYQAYQRSTGRLFPVFRRRRVG